MADIKQAKIGSTTYDIKSIYQDIADTRDSLIAPSYVSKKAQMIFSNNGMPTASWWSGFHVNGWSNDYTAWELVGPNADADQRETPLYLKTGKSSTGWGSWRKIYDTKNPPKPEEIVDSNYFIVKLSQDSSSGSGYNLISPSLSEINTLIKVEEKIPIIYIVGLGYFYSQDYMRDEIGSDIYYYYRFYSQHSLVNGDWENSWESQSLDSYYNNLNEIVISNFDLGFNTNTNVAVLMTQNDIYYFCSKSYSVSWYDSDYIKSDGSHAASAKFNFLINTGVTYQKGRDNAPIRTSNATSNSYNPLLSLKTYQGSWDFASYTDNRAIFTYIADTDYNSNTMNPIRQYFLYPGNTSGYSIRNISYGTSATPPSGQAGDIYIQYIN